MGTVTQGLIEAGSFFMSLAPVVPTGSLAFGVDDTDVTEDDTYLYSEITRKVVAWSWDGTTPRGEVTLAATEANGSYIQEIGLCGSPVTGSDLFSRDLSAIGSKTSAFSVQTTFDLRIAKRG